MKNFSKIVLTIISLIVALYLLEDFFQFGLKQNQNIKMAYIQKVPKDAEVLVHGPCEPLWMVSPEEINKLCDKSAYNLALSHSDFADNYIHFYQYLKYNKKPKLLLLYVTPESFDKRFNTFNSYRFAAYLDDSLIRFVVKENDPNYYQYINIPFMRFAFYSSNVLFNVIQGYKHYFTNRNDAYYPDGFEPPTKRVWGNHAANFAELYKTNTVFKWDDLREKYFRLLIQLAQSKHIQVILYESPVHKASLPSQVNRNEFLKRIKRLSNEYHVEFFQFEKLPIENEERYFISTLNFNMDGVKIFNDTLAKFLNTRFE